MKPIYDKLSHYLNKKTNSILNIIYMNKHQCTKLKINFNQIAFYELFDKNIEIMYSNIRFAIIDLFRDITYTDDRMRRL